MSRATRRGANRGRRFPLVQSNNGSVNGTSLTVTLGATPIENNYLIVRFAVSASIEANITAPAGFTKAVSTNSTGNHYVAIYYKKAGAAESTGVTVSTTASARTTMHVGEYANLAAASVLDQTASANSGASIVTSQTTGTTAATASEPQLVVAAVCVGSSEGGWLSWTNYFSGRYQLASLRFNAADLTALAVGTFETSARWVTAQQAAACIATFKAA